MQAYKNTTILLSRAKAVWTQRAVQTASTCCFQSLLHLFKLLTRKNSCSPQRAGGTKKAKRELSIQIGLGIQ